MLEKLFRLRENKTTVRTEVVAGLTTFMTMAYILAVNPNVLADAGLPRGGVLIATALAAAVGTLLMAFLANYPFALAAGMGLNAYFAYTVCGGMGYSWQFALLAVFVEGVVFLLLSVTSVRESVFNAIPLSLKKAVSAGIGLFITFIALKTAGILVQSPATFVAIIPFHDAPIHTNGIVALMAIAGILVTAVLHAEKVKGAILLGILATWALGILAEVSGVYRPDSDGDGLPDKTEIAWNLDPFKPEDARQDADGDGVSNLAEFVAGTGAADAGSFPVKENPDGSRTPVPEGEIVRADAKFDKFFSTVPSFSNGYWKALGDNFRDFGRTFGALFSPSSWTHSDKKGGKKQGWDLALSLDFFVVMFAFLFVDLFDTLGTLIGVSLKGGMLDKDGKLPRIGGALCADSVATSVGAVLGTSTTTTFVESSAGVAVGGRTGLTAAVSAAMFLAAILLSPVFLAIPGFATAPALVFVGVLMTGAVAGIDFDDAAEGVPAFLAIVAMPFFYSISDGIMFGVISYAVLNLCVGRGKKVSPVMYALAAIFAAKYALL